MSEISAKNSPMVSVIIPVYNTEAYLRQCVDSVLDQSYQDFEIILVDDGSTDLSGSICDDYEMKDDRITVIHKANGGQSSARNAALEVAKGLYIYFLDSDDYIGSVLLKDLVSTAEQTNADIVFFEAKSFLDQQEKTTVPVSLKHFEYTRNHSYEVCRSRQQYINLVKNQEYFVCTPLHFYRKAYLDQHHIRFHEGIIHEDNLFSALVYLHDGITAHLQSKAYMRRLRSQSTMTTKDPAHLRYRFESLMIVYRELSKTILQCRPEKEIIQLMINDSFDAVRFAYENLTTDDQKACNASYRRQKRHCLLHFAKYDYQIARKTAGQIIRLIVKASHFIRQTDNH